MEVAVIGLGHLGLPLALLLAEAGHQVTAVDRDAAHLASLQNGEIAWHEPGLAPLLAATRPKLTFDSKMNSRAEASIIAVGTPAAADGRYSADHVLAVAAALGDILRLHTRPHTVIILSTIMPGTLAGPVAEALAAASGRTDIGLCYCPAFGALGSLLRDYRNPDFLLIGQSSPDAGDCAETLYRSIQHNDAKPLRRCLLDAELAKIALNNYIITKISFANMVGALCGRIEGADADQVLSVLGEDRRIGGKFLKAAMPYGGPCFARDVGAWEALGRDAGAALPLAAATAEINAALHEAIVAELQAAAGPGGIVAILGLAFRHLTNVAEASPAIAIAEALAQSGCKVRAWDPLASPPLGHGIHSAASLAEAVQGAAAILIANNDPACAALPVFTGVRPVVLDYWRVIDPTRRDIRLRRFGRSLS